MSPSTCGCANCRRGSVTAGHCVDIDGNWWHTCPALVRAHEQRTDRLRAAGLLPGPGDIVVSRADIALAASAAWGAAAKRAQLNALGRLRAALSQPHPEETS